jgi:phage portal protein BeeE
MVLYERGALGGEARRFEVSNQTDLRISGLPKVFRCVVMLAIDAAIMSFAGVDRGG